VFKIKFSEIAEKCKEFAFITLDEFIPVVKFNATAFTKPVPVQFIETKDAVVCSNRIEEDKRKQSLFTFILPSGKIKLPFTVESGAGTWDNDGYIEAKIEPTTANVQVSSPSKIICKYGKSFDIEINISGNQEREFNVKFYANDNEDDYNKGECNNVFCGSIEFKVHNDVFSLVEANQLIEEIEFIKPFVEAGSPDEYSNNYCMAAAERGLSKLFNNTTDFYSVDRSHNRLNSISFQNKGAKDRGDKFKTLGFVKSTFTFEDYTIDHKLRISTKNESDVYKNMYNVVSLKNGSSLYKYLSDEIGKKIGFHVFYMSVSNDFHTLLLVIDNTDKTASKYAIYDQHGKTSSFGNFSEIEAGLARQTSWTFLNDYYNRGCEPSKYGKTTTRLWKIQRKI
jgi:hypothetical protein